MKVQQADVNLHDAKRKLDMPVHLYFPEEPGQYPVIIFSHGAGASGWNYEALGQQWASNGYVCIHPTHSDSVRQRTDNDVSDESMATALRALLLDSQAWRERPRDISFVIDSFTDLEQRVPALKGKLDRERVGVGGHSFGAFTAMTLGGAQSTFDGVDLQSARDPRVKAIIAMSPQGDGQMGLTSESFRELKVPALFMLGSRDRGSARHDAKWRKQPYQLSPAGDKYLLWLEGANHFSFVTAGTGVFRTTDGTAYAKAIRASSTAFWDAYLKGDTNAKKFLHSNQLIYINTEVIDWSRR